MVPKSIFMGFNAIYDTAKWSVESDKNFEILGNPGFSPQVAIGWYSRILVGKSMKPMGNDSQKLKNHQNHFQTLRK